MHTLALKSIGHEALKGHDVTAQGEEAYAFASVGFSRNAAVVNSQGREPLVQVARP